MSLSSPFSPGQRIVQIGDPECSAFKKFSEYKLELYQKWLNAIEILKNAGLEVPTATTEGDKETVALGEEQDPPFSLSSHTTPGIANEHSLPSQPSSSEPSTQYQEAIRRMRSCELYEDPRIADNIHLFLFHPNNSPNVPQILPKEFLNEWSLFQKKCSTEGISFESAGNKWNDSLLRDERMSWSQLARDVKYEQRIQIRLGFIQIE
uniref:Uncharacterized protein n=1 Tax=Caenorhabditis tropicalis TaxID=1561998 RepID=A0A1I7U5E5_9PELO